MATLAGAVSLAATPTLSVGGGVSLKQATVTLTVNKTLATNGVTVKSGAVLLTVNKTLAVNGVVVKIGNIALTVNKTLSIAGIRTTFAYINLVVEKILADSGYQSSPSVAVGQARGMTLHLLNTNGTYRCRLLDHMDLSISREVASKGSISFRYPESGNNFAALREFVDQKKQAEVRIWINGGIGQYILGGFLEEASKDDVDPQKIWTFGGHFYEKRSEEAILYPVAGVDNGETLYDSITPGGLIIDVLSKIKARGTLTDISTSTFNYTVDSKGVTWPTSVVTKFSPGIKLKDVLDELRDKGFIEYEITSNKELKIYSPANWGVDRTVIDPKVILTSWKSIQSSPRKYSAIEMATHLLVVGNDAIQRSESNATALAKLGRQIETYESAGGLTTQGAVTAYAQLKATTIGDAQYEVTHELNLHDLGPMPMEDFNLGDWVWSDTPNAVAKEKLQVAQWTLTSGSSNELTASVSLNSLFFTNAQKLKRRLDKMATGSVIPGTSNPPIEEADNIAPNPPTGLSASPEFYSDLEGNPNSNITFSWSAPLLSVDGSPYDDHDYYLPEWRFQTGFGYGFPSTYYQLPLSTIATTNFDVSANVNIELRVRAVDRWGNVSDYSSTIIIYTGIDEEPPPIPSAPIPRVFLRQIVVPWDGLGAFGEPMPADFDRTDVYWSLVNNFALGAGTKFEMLKGQGAVVFDGATYGVTYYFKFVSVDTAGNWSDPSAQGSAVGTRAILDDIGDGIITAAKMADNQPLGPKIAAEEISTPHLTIATFSDNMLPNGGFEDSALNGPVTVLSGWTIGGTSGGSPTLTRETTGTHIRSGSASAKIVLTQAQNVCDIQSEPIPTKPGDVWYFEISAKASRTLGAGFGVYAVVGIANPPNDAALTFTGVMPTLTTTYGATPSGFNLTIPSTVGAGVIPKYIQFIVRCGDVTGDAATATIWLDECRARKVVGTAEIQDASIVRAKIGILAVGDVNAENINAGKILTGTMTAIVTVSGEIRTASFGARVAMNSSGIQAYNSAGTQTVSISSSTGMVAVTGEIKTNISGDRIELTVSTGYPTIFFYDNAAGTNRAYINGVPISGGGTRMGLGMNSGETSAQEQTTLFLMPASFSLMYNTGPTNVNGPNKLRGGYVEGTQTYCEIGVTDDTVSGGLTKSNAAFWDDGTITITVSPNGAELWTNAKVRATGGFISGGAIEMWEGNGANIFPHIMGGVLNFRYVSGGASVPIGQSNGAAYKTFIIDHPTPAKKENGQYLIHATTESPHNGVEYWGTVEIFNGIGTVKLPDYFEHLTYQQGRIVMLTLMSAGDYAAPSATYPRNGQFDIRTFTTNSVSVSWLVKAIRKDVAPLLVEPHKDEILIHGEGAYRSYTPLQSRTRY